MEFLTIKRSLLEAVVKRDLLTIREVELFKAVDLWATKECERQGLAPHGKVKRMILGEQIVKGMRFPAMEEKEFVSIVLDSKILIQEELFNLMENFKGVLTSPIGFLKERRVGTCQSCCGFGSFVSSDDNGGWSNRVRGDVDIDIDTKDYDALEFQVDKDVLLHGICLFGSKDAEYNVWFSVVDDNQDEENFLINSG